MGDRCEQIRVEGLDEFMVGKMEGVAAHSIDKDCMSHSNLPLHLHFSC